MQEIRKTRGISFAVHRVPERRRRFFVEPFPVERGVRAVRDERGERPAERAAHLRVPVFRIEDDVPLRRECPLVFHEAETMRRVFPEKEPEIRLVPHEGVRLVCEKGLRRIGRLAKRRRILSETGFQRKLPPAEPGRTAVTLSRKSSADAMDGSAVRMACRFRKYGAE